MNGISLIRWGGAMPQVSEAVGMKLLRKMLDQALLKKLLEPHLKSSKSSNGPDLGSPVVFALQRSSAHKMHSSARVLAILAFLSLADDVISISIRQSRLPRAPSLPQQLNNTTLSVLEYANHPS